jgi:hypothetical protein
MMVENYVQHTQGTKMKIQGCLHVNSDPPYIGFDSVAEGGCGRYLDRTAINEALVELVHMNKNHNWPKEYQLRIFGEFQASQLRELGLLDLAAPMSRQ